MRKLKQKFLERKWKKREVFSGLLAPFPILIRLDGRNFSNLLAEFEKPYDLRFAKVIVDSGKELMKEFNALFAFTFSDEITFFFQTEFFGGRVEKINSIISSEFSSRVSLRLGMPVSFDSRIIATSGDDVWEYLAWRQEEAWRNHLNSYAFYTLLREIGDRTKVQKYLNGKKSNELHDILFQRGINPAKNPAWQKRGIFLYWKEMEFEKEFNGRIVRFKRRRIVENWEPPLFSTEEGRNYLAEILSPL